LFGFLAGITERVELATGVLVAPIRQAVLLAKQAAEVDVLSGGRLRLGLGVGGNRRESDALNENYDNRGRRIEEQIAVLRALWTEEAVTFAGEWQQLDGAGLAPRPIQRPIPIWLAGMAERSIERAARLADGWMPLPMEPDHEAKAMIEQFRRHGDRCGRAPDSLGLEAYLSFAELPTERWQQHRDGWRELGATHLTVTTYGAGLASANEHLSALASIKSVLDR
jgi:probable F420-dependent oxidoreductase